MLTPVSAVRTFVHDMATTKTTRISVRLPVEVAAAIEQDAAFSNQSVGTLLRDLLTRRYTAPVDARKVITVARRSDNEPWELQ